MTQAQWIQVGMILVGVLVAGVVMREGLSRLRLDFDQLAPKVEGQEKSQVDRQIEQLELVSGINLKLAKLEGLPSRVGELATKLDTLDRTVQKQTARARTIGELERKVANQGELQNEIRLRLAEKGIRTQTPVRGLPTIAPPSRRPDDDDEGGNT